MIVLLLAVNLLLLVLICLVGSLVVGSLRIQARLKWRIDQLEATTPSRVGRSGLRAGKKAPDFTLPLVGGGAVSFHDWRGDQVMLVFMQSTCQPCRSIVPELNELHHEGRVRVLAIQSGPTDVVRRWKEQVGASFPIGLQEDLSISRKYEVFASPFAFLIDRQGSICARGIIQSRQQIEFVLEAGAEYASRLEQIKKHSASGQKAPTEWVGDDSSEQLIGRHDDAEGSRAQLTEAAKQLLAESNRTMTESIQRNSSHERLAEQVESNTKERDQLGGA